MKPRIGLTVGDPKGIGPEIAAQVLQDPEIQKSCELVCFGNLTPPQNLSDVGAAILAIRSLKEAQNAVLEKSVQALVTGPVNKSRLRLVDPEFLGHTEFFAQGTATEHVTPLFVAHQWRVALVTGHLPLKEVAHRLNAVDILKTIRMTAKNLIELFHIPEPKIAVAGLNPHAGEQGVLGDEEKKIITPAILQARKESIQVEGPFSPDTLFWQMTQGKWDAVIAMYHDQGLIPIKTLAFKETVQVSLGLPFLRVSVDHGTAENIVGTGNADATNLKAAVKLAISLLV